MKCGLASVTFRQLGWREVIQVAGDCGLSCIEWGGDIHVPPGDALRAREVYQATAEAGLEVLSYGSYYRLGGGQDFGPVLDTARALRAGVIRVWAGAKGSARYSAGERGQAVADAQIIADMAAAHSIAVAFEYHRNTLTDTSESALALLAQVGRDNVKTYWQPNPDLTHEQRLAGLAAVLPHLENVHVHVTQRPSDGAHLPLEDVLPQWRAYMGAAHGRARAALIEFVKDNDPAQCARDAACLRRICREN
jgi:sugar phosphate isomerase/epimerase